MRGRKPIKDYLQGEQFKSGYSMTRLYGIWAGMKTRCFNPNEKKYKCYGGRGIGMCDEWKNDFTSFALWAVGNGYSESLSIDRINPNEGYNPQNCRWCDMKTQQNNRTNNHRLEYNGETHTIAEWAKITGIKRHTIDQRIRYGWTIERILTTPTLTIFEAGELGRRARKRNKE